MRKRLFEHTNLAGDNYIYQDDVTGIVTVDTKFPGESEFTPNLNVLIEYEDEPPPSEDNPNREPFVTVDFNEQQIVDMNFINKMAPLPDV